MARWKVAGQMAVVMRDAEKQAEERRILAEQRLETIHCGKVLRKLARGEAQFDHRAIHSLAPKLRQHNILLKENTNQTLNSEVAGSPYYQRQDDRNHAMLLESLRRLDQALDEVKQYKMDLQILNNKIRAVEMEHMAVKKKLKVFVWKCENVHVIRAGKVVRRVELMEHRYGLQLAENRRLRDMIQHLQMERDQVKQLYEDLDHDIHDLSKVMGEHIDVAKTMYDDRDSTKRNMQKLTEHLTKAATSFESDMQLLQFRIDVLRRMERFMTDKNKNRPDESRERRAWLRSQPSVNERDANDYCSWMEKIKKEMKEDDFHTIIGTFMELEQENYMLFKNISETRDSCTNLELEIDRNRGRYKTLNKDNQLTEQETMARKVELLEKIEHCKQTAEKTEEHAAAADQVIKTYIQGILDIMVKLGFNPEDITRLAGVYKRVEEKNVHMFLAEIERYVNSLFELKAASDYITWNEARRKAMSMTSMNPDPLPPRLELMQRVLVVPPVHEESEDLDDPILPMEAAFKPMTSTEILHHVEEDLESQATEDPSREGLPSPSMKDPTSDAIGDNPHSPPRRISMSVDVL